MKVLAHVKAFFKDEEGASGIEYALLAVMVAVALASFTTPIAKAVKGVFTDIQNALPAAP